LNGFANALEREAMSDYRPGIHLAGPEQATHLLPGLIHLPPGDAVEREPLEDDVPGEVDLGSLAGCAQQIDSTAEACRGKGLSMAARMAAHLADQIHTVAGGELANPCEHVITPRVQRYL